MNVWYTSDTHFGHKNIMKYNPLFRQYPTLDAMDEGMIEIWNRNVKKLDRVFILGDVSFYKSEKSTQILQQLNGTKVLIRGNHDSHCLKRTDFRLQFEAIHDYLEVNVNGTNMVLFHFPISSWHRIHHGAVHLHGHCHGAPTGVQGKVLDVGWDNIGSPISHEDVIKFMENKPLMSHGNGK